MSSGGCEARPRKARPTRDAKQLNNRLHSRYPHFVFAVARSTTSCTQGPLDLISHLNASGCELNPSEYASTSTGMSAPLMSFECVMSHAHIIRMKTMKRELCEAGMSELSTSEKGATQPSAMCIPGQILRPKPYAWCRRSAYLVPISLPSSMKRSGLNWVGTG